MSQVETIFGRPRAISLCMIKRYSLSSLLRQLSDKTLGICMAFFVCLSVGQETKANHEIPEQQLQLKITHTLYSSVIGAYIKEGDESFRPYYLADRYLLLSFLRDWNLKISTENYSSTKHVFDSLISQHPLYRRHREKIESLIEYPQKRYFNFGYYRSDALLLFYKSEGLPIEKRLSSIIEAVRQTLIISSNDNVTVVNILAPLALHNNSAIRDQANSAIASMKIQNAVDVARTIKDGITLFMGGGQGVLTMAGRPEQLLRLTKNFTFNSYQSVIKRAKAGQAAAKRAVEKINLKLNPYLPKDQQMREALALSLEGHVAVGVGLGVNQMIGESESRESMGSERQAAPPPVQYAPTEIVFANLWQRSIDQYDALSEEVVAIDKDSAEPAAILGKTELVSKLKNGMKGSTENLLSLITNSEKHLAIDRRKTHDYLAFEESNLILNQIRKLVLESVGESLDSTEEIDKFREIVIESLLGKYSRDYPNVHSQLLGWGGNCVAQTMIISALMNEFKLSPNFQLQIAIYSDHIEPVIFDSVENTYIFLMSGKIETEVRANLYSMPAIYGIILRNFSDEKVSIEKFLISRYSPPAEDMEREGEGKNGFSFKNVSGFFLNIKQMLYRDQGILESIGASEGSSVSAQIGGGGSDIPEFATQTFAEMAMALSHSGLSGLFQLWDNKSMESEALRSCPELLVVNEKAKNPLRSYEMTSIKLPFGKEFYNCPNVYKVYDSSKYQTIKKIKKLSYESKFRSRLIKEIYESDVTKLINSNRMNDLFNLKIQGFRFEEVTEQDLVFIDKAKMDSEIRLQSYGSYSNQKLNLCDYSGVGLNQSSCRADIVSALAELEVLRNEKLGLQVARSPIEFVKALTRNKNLQVSSAIAAAIKGFSKDSVHLRQAKAIISQYSKNTTDQCVKGFSPVGGIELPEGNFYHIKTGSNCKVDSEIESHSGVRLSISQVERELLALKFGGGFHLWDQDLLLARVKALGKATNYGIFSEPSLRILNPELSNVNSANVVRWSLAMLREYYETDRGIGQLSPQELEIYNACLAQSKAFE